MRVHLLATLLLFVATLVTAAQESLVVALILAAVTVASWATLTIRSHRRWPQGGPGGAPVIVSFDPNASGTVPVAFITPHGMST